MATTESKILSIDVTPGIDSLKKLRLEIKELKDALSTLEIGSEEYNETSEKLWEKQSRLTELIKDSKRPIEALEGSYDHLVAKMKELKAEWRATADEGKRNDLGKQILGINNQLKDLDASTGNFQRNVGDYKNAFSEAFDKMLGPLGKVNGTLGILARDVKGMIPLIKQVNSTATSSLKGIRALIAETGIGLLIIAIGELAANWDAVADAISSVFSSTNNAILSAEQLKSILEQGNYELNLTIEKMRILGSSELDIINTKLKHNAKEQERINGLVEQNNKLIENGTYSERKKAQASNEELGTQMDNLVVEHSRLIDQRELAKLKEDVAKKTKEASDAEKQSAEAEKQGAAYAKERARAKEQQQKAADALVETIRKSSLNEYQIKEEEYNKNIALLESYKNEGYITEKELVDSKKILEDNFNKWKEDKQKEENEKLKQEAIKAAQNTAKEALSKIDRELKQKEFLIKIEYDKKALEKGDTKGIFEGALDWWKGNDITEQAKIKAAELNEIFEANKKASEDRIAKYEEELKKLPEGSAEYLETQKKISEEKINLNNLETQNEVDNMIIKDETEDEMKNRKIQRLQAISQAFQTLASLVNQYASAQQSEIQQELKGGKITEEQAKKRFKQVKAMQYGAAVMNTAAGIITAIAAGMQLGMPMGPIVAAAQGAAVAAAGAIQIATIKKTKFDSGSAGDIKTPNLNTITNEYTPNYVTNVQTNTELDELSNAMGNIQPVVQVVDIESGLNTAKVRDSESTY